MSEISSDAFYRSLDYIIYQSYYYDAYMKASALYIKLISGFIAITSSVSIASWIIWNDHSAVWAILVGASQVLGLISSNFHYTEHICLISLMLPEINNIIIEMESKIILLDTYASDEEIANLIEIFEKRYNEIEAKYTSSIDFPNRKRCQKIAEKSRDNRIAAKQFNSSREDVTT